MSKIIPINEVRIGDTVVITQTPYSTTQIKIRGIIKRVGRNISDGFVGSISFEGFVLNDLKAFTSVELVDRPKNGADYIVSDEIAQRTGTFNTVYVFTQRDGSLWTVVGGVLSRCTVEEGDLDNFKSFKYKQGLIPDGLYKNAKGRMFLVLGSDLKFVDTERTFKVTEKVEKDLYLAYLRGELAKA